MLRRNAESVEGSLSEPDDRRVLERNDEMASSAGWLMAPLVATARRSVCWSALSVPPAHASSSQCVKAGLPLGGRLYTRRCCCAMMHMIGRQRLARGVGCPGVDPELRACAKFAQELHKAPIPSNRNPPPAATHFCSTIRSLFFGALARKSGYTILTVVCTVIFTLGAFFSQITLPCPAKMTTTL
jgi:hypothetical protein